MRILLPLSLLLTSLGAPLSGQESAVPGPVGGLEAALGSILPRHLESDLHFLASDAMAGRDTPSQELTQASHFLRARLQRLGFAPVEEQWFHWYELSSRGLDAEHSGLTLGAGDGALELAFGEDYFLQRSRDLFDHTVRGAVVSVGGGTRGEFEGLDLSGSWALVFDDGRPLRRVQRYAQKAGALGVLAAPAPDYGKRPYAERFRSITKLLGDPRMGKARGKAAEQEDVPIVMMTESSLLALLEASTEPFEGLTPPAGHSLGLEVEERRVVSVEVVAVPNVCGLWPGDDPELASEVIVLSAHFDHVGVQGDDIFNGADDNGSGTTGLLAVAEALVAYGPLDRSVLVLWLSGEEKGLWGSDAWTRSPLLPAGARAVANLNIDMIGRTEPDELYLTPTDEHPSFNALAQAAYAVAPQEGFPRLLSQDQDWARSDHYNFDRNLEIPVAFLSAGEHPDYHQPSDTPDKIDYDKLARIARVVVRMLDHIQARPLVRGQ